MAIKLEGYLSEIEQLEGELTIPKIIDSGGGGSVNLQEKSVSYTPTESAQSDMVTASPGYDGLSSVDVTVGAISSSYVGSGVARKSSSDLTVSGATVTAPAGYYESSASKAVASGTAGTPTATKGSVSNHSVSVTPSVTNTTGYITGSTKTGTAVTVSASELVSGTKSITANGSGIDVTNYESVDVDVQGGGGGAGAVVQDQNGYLVLSPDGGGGGGGATGTFTPASDTTSYIVDTGIDFTQFAFAATTDIGGSGKRSVRTGFCDFAGTNYVLCYFTTNNSGSGIASDTYSSSSGYFTKNGTSITISKSGTYMLGGVTYRWIAT